MVTKEELEIRATHPYGFRSGEWATFCGTTYYYVESLDVYRWCFVVLFPDGTHDHWPVEDGNSWNYEFRRKVNGN